LITNTKGGGILPLGYGINVNLPYITSFTNDSCVNPPFINTRLTGGADVDGITYNETSVIFTYKNIVSPGLSQCINGECSLPGETDVPNKGCNSSVSVFTVDYDAPIGGSCGKGPDVRSLLSPLVKNLNSTHLVRDLPSNTTVTGSNSTGTSARSWHND
jgi:5'-nucleotidase